jgi:peptide/nickel transport system ATP-binding protein
VTAGEASAGPVLEVRDLRVVFTQYEAGLRRRRLEVISGIDLVVRPGELVAVVGSSGSGKSLLAHAVLGVLPRNATVSGQILYRGEQLSDIRLRALRGREICLIPQTVAALDPVTKVGPQVERSAHLSGSANPPAAALTALRRLDLPDGIGSRYPHELSGGMARRVLTATATVGRPALVLADEPTPGLHPAVVAETLAGLRAMADEGAAVVLITHDLLGALEVADSVAVFYAGTTVEVCPADRFAGEGADLRHPYTRALWAALPGHGFVPLAGAQPPPTDLPPGCLFAPRCPERSPDCDRGRPESRVLNGALVRCIRA